MAAPGRTSAGPGNPAENPKAFWLIPEPNIFSSMTASRLQIKNLRSECLVMLSNPSKSYIMFMRTGNGAPDLNPRESLPRCPHIDTLFI